MLDVIPSKKKEPLRVDWKLPARLRRPISAQLAKDRKKKGNHQEIIHFERKKLVTPKVWDTSKKDAQIRSMRAAGITLPTHHFFHTKIEKHTSDINKSYASKVHIALPPYSAPLGKQRRVASKHVALKKHTKTIIPKMPEPIFAERDIAYEFAPSREDLPEVDDAPEVIESPVVSLPFSVSVLHFNQVKNSAVNAFFLLLGFAVISILIWSLQGAGRGTAVIASLEKRAVKAALNVTTAQTALAQADTTAGEKSFQAAFQELTMAQTEMDKALANSKNVLSILDVTGTVRAGQNMLDVGTALTQAGQHISRAMAPFFQKEAHVTLTDAISASGPELVLAQEQLDAADAKLQGISGGLLPPQLAEQIKKLQEVIPHASEAIRTLRSESQTFLTLLGATRDKQYLFLFANNDEIRPVGGFIGTIGLVNISRGAVENVDVHSVYDGDGQLKDYLAPPNPLLSIVSRWYLRDSNWFVDYAKSAQKAAQLFEKEGGPTVDGVVLMTPTVIKNLLAVTGPITVPGYSQTVSAENFSEVAQGEVTYNYDKTLNKPKQFLSDLTPILLTKLFASAQIQALGAFTKSLAEKDLLFYFKDQDAQAEVSRLGWGGQLPTNAPGFLMVDNANIGGHKSDQFIEQEIDYRTTITSRGDADVVVTVRRTHKGPDEKIAYPYPEGEDPAFKVNTIYQRMLVPKGAMLLESKGFTPLSEVPHPVISVTNIPLKADSDVTAWQAAQHQSPDGTTIGSESGYTFFANWIVTKPGETSVTLTHYRIPGVISMPSYIHSAASYSMSIFKQPGQQRTSVRGSIQIPEDMKIVHSVPNSGVTREADNTYVYRGQLTFDVVPGIVFERK